MVAPPEIGAREDDIASLDYTQRIPNELLTRVVDYLPASKLLLVSSVSKRFRTAITRDSRFYIKIYIDVTDHNISRKICSRQVARAHAILEHATLEHLPLDVHVVCRLYDVDALGTVRDYLRDIVFPIVGAALRILVQLAVTIPDYYSEELRAVLLQPAPFLRDLSLCGGSAWYDTAERKFAHVVPRDVFSGIAPQLQRVYLCNVALAKDPIPALISVRSVVLRYDTHTPDIHVSQLFPSITELEVGFESHKDPWGLRLSHHIDYSDLCLEHLHLEGTSRCSFLHTIAEGLDLARIPAVTYTTLVGCPEDHKMLLDRTSGTLSMRITGIAATAAFGPEFESEYEFHTTQGGLRRVFYFERFDYPQGFNNFAFRIIDIRLEITFVGAVLDFECDLPVLRRLRIDFSKPADFGKTLKLRSGFIGDTPGSVEAGTAGNCDSDPPSKWYLLRCPLLEVVAFTAPKRYREIYPYQVGFLGRAFGQLERPREARARLEMFGVGFVEHSRRELLDLVFPDIIYHSRDEVLDWGENEDWPRTR
ncbi:hypothetical protein EXIGLDRAFT_728168 [Exidia glandulosa HHB12029]|uniref:F-box domain-containing protein n=1 Tax=Exidia glandulosa HHB12029 TaxID=1314781 RepID=A0A165D1N2_EXIGL|nr:hypothetical protein EXIGLDRAFT_728168 [Exidia glandulosa HHB12029]